MAKVLYVHNEMDKEVLGEVLTNRSLTVEEALDLIGVDMDQHAEDNGWDGYDYNAITIEY